MKQQFGASKGKRAAATAPPAGQTRVTIRLDDDVLDWFRCQVHEAHGGNYEAMINDALREFVRQRREPVSETIQRVLREELCHPSRRTARDILRDV